MRSIRIAHTMYLLLGAALLAGGVASLYLTMRCSSVSRSYSQIIFGEEKQAQQVRELQVAFKKQVQAWKDILLRGRDDSALEKYNKEFHAQAAAVDAGAAALAATMKDSRARTELQNFAREHQRLDEQYEKALTDYRVSRDFSAADLAVKGKDRVPTDLLDGVATELAALAEQVPAVEAERLRKEQLVMSVVLVLLWGALTVWSVNFARSLGRRMHQGVGFVQSLAEGDLTAVEPEKGRSDELGLLIAAMSTMRDQLRSIIMEIQDVAGSLAAGADAVASSSTQIARTASEQRNESSQVASALEEMIATVHEVARHCQEANLHAEQSGELTAASVRSVEGVAEEVRELAEGAAANARAVHELGERTRKIGQIVDLIRDIAGQTNLLALNAAIESARAGEQGRGFAVVAGEVRRLAERTSEATQEISSAVQMIQTDTQKVVQSIHQTSDRVGQSVAAADAAANSLQQVGTSVAEVRQRISQIAQSSEEQSQSSALVGRSMQEMAAGIASTSEGAEEAAHTAEELSAMAQQLEQHSHQFETGESQQKSLQLVPRRSVA